MLLYLRTADGIVGSLSKELFNDLALLLGHHLEYENIEAKVTGFRLKTTT